MAKISQEYNSKAIEQKWPFGSAQGKQVESKWQKLWKKGKLFKASDTSKKPKFYLLVEFPYPSGDLHMGHWYAFAPADVFARFKRMQGFEVLFPIGFDAFGLPAENAAIQRGVHPRDWTYGNIETMLRQFESMGPSFDWDRVIISCDTEYYRWTQWMFLKMYENGLAYRAKVPANWCPKCQTVLANEQVENGKCWRHPGVEVIQKEIEQWLFKITDYAEKLLWSDKPRVQWPKSVVEGQNNWIGKSRGIEIEFPLEVDAGPAAVLPPKKPTRGPFSGGPLPASPAITVYTRFPETIFGVTFMVLAPEHALVGKLITQDRKKEVGEYIKQSQKKSALERQALEREKTGVFTGSYCINPVNGEKVPIWIADYVIATYGTGAVMGVPGHDKRDFEFAKKYGLRVIRVIAKDTPRVDQTERVYEGEGILINSGEFSGLKSEVALKKISDYLEKNHLGNRRTTYHLHDWTISRQRYWGAPIPIIYCPKCGVVPVPEKDLPVELPQEVEYMPKGKAPLATALDWVRVKCPRCGGEARREVDTMDTFVDSSWYFFRYVSPHFKKAFADPGLVRAWMPVDVYFGGAEHTLGHTMYARFVTKVLYDLGYFGFDEFATRRVHHGVIFGPDGQKMSKSRGNVVNPDSEVKKYGADCVRMYLCFMAPHEAGGPWNPEGIVGVDRFLRRVWRLVNQGDKGNMGNEGKRIMHKTIKKVTEDLEALKFNTAIAALMEWVNYLGSKNKNTPGVAKTSTPGESRPTPGVSAGKDTPRVSLGSRGVSAEELKTLLLLLAPFAPHMAEELFQVLRSEERKAKSEKFESIHLEKWPEYDPKLVMEEEVTIPVQVNGKLRDSLIINHQSSIVQSEVENMARSSEKVAKYLEGKKVVKVIFVPGKLINFVTK